jgi:urease accessory protein
MLIKEKVGNLASFEVSSRKIDLLPIEWFETNKRILHKRTKGGIEAIIKFLKESPDLKQDDVLFEDDESIIAIDIQPADAIIVQPKSMYQMAALCYEIGNKHLPLFYFNDEILVPYEAPLFRMLTAAGYSPAVEKRKLLHQLKTNVSPHQHAGNTSLFSKILQLTTPANG